VPHPGVPSPMTFFVSSWRPRDALKKLTPAPRARVIHLASRIVLQQLTLRMPMVVSMCYKFSSFKTLLGAIGVSCCSSCLVDGEGVCNGLLYVLPEPMWSLSELADTEA